MGKMTQLIQKQTRDVQNECNKIQNQLEKQNILQREKVRESDNKKALKMDLMLYIHKVFDNNYIDISTPHYEKSKNFLLDPKNKIEIIKSLR